MNSTTYTTDWNEISDCDQKSYVVPYCKWGWASIAGSKTNTTKVSKSKKGVRNSKQKKRLTKKQIDLEIEKIIKEAQQ